MVGGVPPGSGSRNGSEHGLGVERVQSWVWKPRIASGVTVEANGERKRLGCTRETLAR